MVSGQLSVVSGQWWSVVVSGQWSAVSGRLPNERPAIPAALRAVPVIKRRHLLNGRGGLCELTARRAVQ